jgi:hypothetical protein
MTKLHFSKHWLLGHSFDLLIFFWNSFEVKLWNESFMSIFKNIKYFCKFNFGKFSEIWLSGNCMFGEFGKFGKFGEGRLYHFMHQMCAFVLQIAFIHFPNSTIPNYFKASTQLFYHLLSLQSTSKLKNGTHLAKLKHVIVLIRQIPHELSKREVLMINVSIYHKKNSFLTVVGFCCNYLVLIYTYICT